MRATKTRSRSKREGQELGGTLLLEKAVALRLLAVNNGKRISEKDVHLKS